MCLILTTCTFLLLVDKQKRNWNRPNLLCSLPIALVNGGVHISVRIAQVSYSEEKTRSTRRSSSLHCATCCSFTSASNPRRARGFSEQTHDIHYVLSPEERRRRFQIGLFITLNVVWVKVWCSAMNTLQNIFYPSASLGTHKYFSSQKSAMSVHQERQASSFLIFPNYHPDTMLIYCFRQMSRVRIFLGCWSTAL